MKALVIALGLVMAMVNFSYLSAAEPKGEKAVTMENEEVKKVCPVCGPEEAMAGDEDITLELDDKIYHFCSVDCREEFKNNPEKYLHADHKGHGDHEGHEHK